MSAEIQNADSKFMEKPEKAPTTSMIINRSNTMIPIDRAIALSLFIDLWK